MKTTQRIACYDCRFFSPGEFGCSDEWCEDLLGDFEDDNKGECRRYPLHYRYGHRITPPNGDYFESADWPKVNASQWCGEFVRRERASQTAIDAVPENHPIETAPKQNIRKQNIAAKGRL